jgi:methylated-DNA-[protein]-cysteine S-methyltransferase
MSTTQHICTIDSAVGPLELRAGPTTLHAIRFVDTPPDPHEELDDLDSQVLRTTITQLKEYFAGERTDFDLPLDIRGTPFQQQVWSMLAEIPYGATWSYAELARRIGAPTAFRAVGAANGQNPLPIVLPCHRVVGSNGKLVGYGGGMDRKSTLLQLEATVQLQRDFG